MLIPGVRVHFGNFNTAHHEQLLYNTLRYQLQSAIGYYLARTQRPNPIYSVIDMSNINFSSI